MQVDFDTPVGYQEPKRPDMTKQSEQDEAAANEDLQNHIDTNTFVAFSGEGNRLDGKKKKCDKQETATVARVRQSTIVDSNVTNELIDCLNFSLYFIAVRSWNSRLYSSIWSDSIRSISKTNQ